MADLGISAWFQLSDCNQFHFSNAQINDVVVRTTNNNQRILIGPTPVDSELPSLLTVSKSNLNLVGNLTMSNGYINSISPGNALEIEKVGFSNNTINANRVTINDYLEVNGILNASKLLVNNVNLLTEDGKFAISNIPDDTLTQDKIKDATISENKIKPQTLTSQSLSNQSITSEKIKDGNISTNLLSNESITTEKYVHLSITNDTIANDAIHTRNYLENSINTVALSNQAVTPEKLAHNLSFEGQSHFLGNVSINVGDTVLNPSSLDVFSNLSLVDAHFNRTYLHTSSCNLGIMTDNPQYTLDVNGDAQIKKDLFTNNLQLQGNIFQNGNRWFATQWFSTPNPYQNCNLCYTDGYVGINEETPSSELHVNGSIKLNSNLNFVNEQQGQSYISSFDSNIGINLKSPQATLDVNGNFAILNQEIIDNNRNIKNVPTMNVNRITINKENDPNSTYEIDVEGDARFNASQVSLNNYYMIISSKGSMVSENDGTYYKIAELKPDNHITDNQGCVTISGNISKFQTSAQIQIVLRTNKESGAPYNITHIYGNSAQELIGALDIQLWRESDASIDFPKYYIYLRTTSNSQFNLQIHGGNIINELFHDWNIKSAEPSANLEKLQSLLDSVVETNYDGNTRFWKNVKIQQALNVGSTLSNNGNVSSTGNVFQMYDRNVPNETKFNIHRHQQKVDFSTNAYYVNGDTWYTENGRHGNLQLSMDNAENGITDQQYFKFNSMQSIEQNNAGIGWCNWLTIKDSKIGINEQQDPKEAIDVNGSAIFRKGQIIIDAARSNNIIQCFDKNTPAGGKQVIIFGKEDYTNNAASISYVQGLVGNPNKIKFGFKDNDNITCTTNNCMGINVSNPTESLELSGNFIGNETTLLMKNTDNDVNKLIGISKRYVNLSVDNAIYDKIVLLFAGRNDNLNKGVINVNGTITHKSTNMLFYATIFYNTQDKNECSVILDCKLNEDLNLFDSLIDFIGFVDNDFNFHLYVKSRSADVLLISFDVDVSQQQGSNIISYIDNRFEGIPYDSHENTYPIADFDTTIKKNVRFFISCNETSKRYTKSRLGYLGIGINLPENQLDVDNTTSTGTLVIKSGQLRTDDTHKQNDFRVNGTSFVDIQGNFLTRNIPNLSIEHEKLSLDTQQTIWENTRSNLNDLNVYPFSNSFGLFTNTPQATIDFSAEVALTNNDGKVNLTTSASNGLGINTPIPKYPLDVNGNIHMTGTIYQNEIVWRTSPFTNTTHSIYTPSNIVIGFDNINHELETLCVNTNIALSNNLGKCVLESYGNMLGINNKNPKQTLDIDGDIGISGIQTINKERDILNVRTLSTEFITVSQSNMGINNVTPNYTLDVDGDINLTGNVFINGSFYNIFKNQWSGSNLGIQYESNVGIGTEIPYDETLSVYNNMSLSNENGKINMHLSTMADFLRISNTLNVPFISLSNDNGNTSLKTHDSNLGLHMSPSQEPNCTLDIEGNLGIAGIQVFDYDRSLSNIKQISTKSVTITESNMGINNENPLDTLSINGSIGFDNQNIILKVDDNYLNAHGTGFVASNIIVNPHLNSNGISVNVNNTYDQQTPAILVKGTHAMLETHTTTEDSSTFHKFKDAKNNVALIGIDGNGFNGNTPDTVNTFSISTDNDLRFMTNAEERVRITKEGNFGIGEQFPIHTLDIGGNGIGIAGDLFVDIDKNVFARNMTIDYTFTTRNISPNVTSTHTYENIDLTLTTSSGGVRSTNRLSPGYETLSNSIYGSPKGTSVIVWNSNMYFSGAEGEGNNTYENYAYQPVSYDTHLPGNENINLDLYTINDKNILNMVGNTKIAASSCEVINPRGHEGTTSLRVRNWDPTSIYNPASNISLHYFEMKLINNPDSTQIISKLDSDKQIDICIDNQSHLQILKTSPHVFIPNDKKFGMHLLSGGGVKTVYADDKGILTNNSSDKRMKDNIKTILESAIPKIQQLNPVTFYWNTKFVDPLTNKVTDLTKSKGIQKEIGMIAQEVQPIIPECVGKNLDETLFIEYNKMIPILVKSIQELIEENKMIKRELGILKSS